MKQQSFKDQEMKCLETFSELPQMFHVYTPENHPIILRETDDYKAAMSIFALCCLAHPDVIVITFEIMSNHLHVEVAGERGDIESLFAQFRDRLERYYRKQGYNVPFSGFTASFKEVSDLRQARNVLAYINRNGFLVNPGHTPFSYQWGANAYFFSSMTTGVYETNRSRMTLRERQKYGSGHCFDGITDAFMIDGYVWPLSFCAIKTGESLFRDAHHYFYEISKNVESYGEIASSIGESIFYTDEDMFNIANGLMHTKHPNSQWSQLSSDERIEVAREMHFKYKASNKQIVRILRLPLQIVESLFGK